MRKLGCLMLCLAAVATGCKIDTVAGGGSSLTAVDGMSGVELDLGGPLTGSLDAHPDGGVVFYNAAGQVLWMDSTETVSVLATIPLRDDLSLVDVAAGPDGTVYVLRVEFNGPTDFISIPPGGSPVFTRFDGVLARVDVDSETGEVYVARDLNLLDFEFVADILRLEGETLQPVPGSPELGVEHALPRAFHAFDVEAGVVLVPSEHQILRYDVDGTVSIFAGTGEPGFSGDGGPATEALLQQPFAVDVGPTGVLITDHGNHRVRRVAPDGTIETLAGNGSVGFSGDGGEAREARFDRPRDVVSYGFTRFFVYDVLNQRVRRVDGAPEPDTP